MTDLVYIGLGSNLGDREHFLREAARALGRIDAVAVLRHSSLYDTAAVGPEQPRYLNAVVELECGLSPRRLLTICKQIERDLDRAPGDRWSPRTIDLDILMWGAEVVAEPDLQVPHLELHNRRFALEPLCELTPDARHPVIGRTLAELLRSLMPQDVVKLDSCLWPG